MSSPSDKRIHPRYPLVLQVHFQGQSEAKDFTENLSAGGLLVRTDRNLVPGERLTLELSFSTLLPPVTLEVEVVRCRAAKGSEPAGVAVRVPDDRPADRAKLAGIAAAAEEQLQGTSRYQLLVVDDNRLLATMYADALRELLSRTKSVAVEFAESAQDALKRLAAEPRINLLVLDRVMPGMDGLELAGRVRQDSNLANIAIVMVSGAESPGAAEDARRAGIDVYLRKPVNLQELVFTVQTLLGRAE